MIWKHLLSITLGMYAAIAISCAVSDNNSNPDRDDCNNDGVVNESDISVINRNLNKPVLPRNARCDYNKDGVIGLDDLATHLQNISN